MNRKSIILLGGTGSRLKPLTISTSKGLQGIYSKPLAYYSISIPFLAGIRDILIITTEQDLHAYMRLLGNGDEFGAKISYVCQHKPNGISEAFILGEEFLDGSPSCLVLGDNLYYSNNFINLLKEANQSPRASIFAYRVANPEAFGVVEVDDKGIALSLEEKPQIPKSNYCVTGLYFVDEKAPKYAKTLKPSARNELEIVSLLDIYLKKGLLDVKKLNRGVFWSDVGNIDSLLEASNFIAAIEKRQNIMIGSPHEISYNNGWITKQDIQKTISKFGKNAYTQYLTEIISN